MSFIADDTVRTRFIKARRLHIAGSIALFVGALTMLLAMHGGASHGGGHHGTSSLLGWPVVIGAVLSFSGLALMFLFWNCPSCKRSLEDKFNPHECPKCGVRLQ